MGDASRARDSIVGNLSSLLGDAVRDRGCEITTSGAVRSQVLDAEVRPDWLVTSRGSPRMVVDVLSPSTRETEMVLRLHALTSVESVELYLVIDSIRQKIWRAGPGIVGFHQVPPTDAAVETPFGPVSQAAIYERSGVPLLEDVSQIVPGEASRVCGTAERWIREHPGRPEN